MDGYYDSCYNMILDCNGFGKRQSKILDEVVPFFAEKLMHPRTLSVLELCFVRTDMEECGMCEYECTNINPRSFIIEIGKKVKGDEFIKTIAHELVHVKQYVRGELKERYEPHSHLLWLNNVVEITEEGYYNSPWEVEARELEQKLFDLFKNRITS